MIPYYMVVKLASSSTHFTRGLVKHVPRRVYFCAVPSQNGDKSMTSPPAPNRSLTSLLIYTLLTHSLVALLGTTNTHYLQFYTMLAATI